jgi:shikimate kinase
MSISDMFQSKGEAYFRAGEARVIARLLDCGPQVLATGGGAFMNEQTRRLIHDKGVSVWLKADRDVLLRRIKRRTDRPLLNNSNPEQTLTELLQVRDPVYAEADLTVQSRDVPHETIMTEIINAIGARLGLTRGQAGQ